jgi:hypothetical protein
MREVISYSVRGADGEIGHLEDLFCKAETWSVHYLVVNAQNWLPGRMVLLSRGWVESVCWEEKRIDVTALRETVRTAAEFEVFSSAKGRGENRILELFGQSKRWIQT